MKLYQYTFDKSSNNFAVTEIDAEYFNNALQPYYSFKMKNGMRNILFEYSLDTVSPNLRYKTPAKLQYFSLEKNNAVAITAFKNHILAEERELYKYFTKRKNRIKKWLNFLEEKEDPFCNLIGKRVRTPLGKEGTIIDYLTKEETNQCHMMGQCIFVELDDGTVEDWCYGLEPVDEPNETEEKEI